MAPPSLIGLPAESQTTIVAYIPRPSDLKVIFLTSRQLRAIATPILYRQVFLDIDK